MKEHQILVWVAAFSGLAGALLSQLMTGLFSYINDRRKQKNELSNQYRNKKSEIGENFYFMNGELMTMINKNIVYWKSRHNQRGESSLNFLNKEMGKLDEYQVKLHTENWKYNLISIYFDVPFNFREMLEANSRSHQFYLKILDLSDQIKKTAGQVQEQEILFQQYNILIFDFCSHLENIYSRMEDNMVAVKAALLSDYQ